MNSRSFLISLFLALSVPSLMLSPAAAQIESMEPKVMKTKSPSHMPSSFPSDMPSPTPSSLPSSMPTSVPSKTPKNGKDESMVAKEGSTRRRRQQLAVMEISTSGSEKRRGI